MRQSNVDPKSFWDGKLLQWEAGRYESESKQGILEKIANRASSSLRRRLHLGTILLSPHVRGKTIVELGCGSGYLAKDMIKAGCAHYIGIDLAPSAIKVAKERNRDLVKKGLAEFHAGDFSLLKNFKADLIFSLGLVDWLSDPEIRDLFKLSNNADYVHTISEKRISLSQFIHRAYVHVSYGHKTGAYRPRYYSAEHFVSLRPQGESLTHYVYRSPDLSFGAFVSNLPLALPT